MIPCSVPKTKNNTARAAGSRVLAAPCAVISLIDYVDSGVRPRCQETIRRNPFFSCNKGGTCLPTAMILVGSHCHPHHVQSSPYSSRLLTMLTTPEGGAAASEPSGRTMVRPWKGTNRSRGRCAEFRVRCGHDARAAAQPAVGGRSRRSRRGWFGFDGWRKKRLKKHCRR